MWLKNPALTEEVWEKKQNKKVFDYLGLRIVKNDCKVYNTQK